MTTNFKSIIDSLNNNETSFIHLGEFHTENKRMTSMLLFGTEDGKLRLQLPSCYTKAGIVELSNRTYTDLMFDNSNKDVNDMVDLFLALETESARQLHERSDEWFSGGTEKMTKEEFEDMITSLVRLLNRQTNVCVRVNIPIATNRNIKQNDNSLCQCQVYNRKSETRQLSDIKVDTQILPFVEISELRMSSTSINLHVNMIECMILKETNEPQTHVVRRINLNTLQNDTCNTHTKTVEPMTGGNIIKTEEKEEIKSDNDNEDIHNENNHDLNESVNGLTNNYYQSDETVRDEQNDSIINEQHFTEQDNAHAHTNDLDELEEVDINVEEEKHNDVFDNSENESENENDGLMEIKNFVVNEKDTLTLKKPDEVYKEIYRAAITKAKKLRQVALEAYLDAKKIKAKFMLEDIYDSDDDYENCENDDEDEESFSNIN
jgi:hypothetical protein